LPWFAGVPKPSFCNSVTMEDGTLAAQHSVRLYADTTGKPCRINIKDMKIIVLGEKDFCEVFSFMGVETLVLTNKEEVMPSVDKYIDKDYLILISYTFYKELRNSIEEVKLKSKRAVILELPSPSQKPEEEFDIKRMLQAVSGVKI